MPAIIQRLHFEVDRFELYTGLKPTRIMVALDVRDAYLVELLALESPAQRKIREHDEAIEPFMRLEFRGYPVGTDPKLPAGAVLVDSERGPAYPLPPPRPVAHAGDSEASPRPWRVEEVKGSPYVRIVASNGRVVGVSMNGGPEDAALIVAAVNAAHLAQVSDRRAAALIAVVDGPIHSVETWDVVKAGLDERAIIERRKAEFRAVFPPDMPLPPLPPGKVVLYESAPATGDDGDR